MKSSRLSISRQPLVTTAAAKTEPAAPVAKTTAAKAEAPAKVELADKLVINLAARSLAAIRGNQKVALYPIGPGKTSTPTPTGYYKVIDKEVNPTWTDRAMLRHPSRPARRIHSATAGLALAATTAFMARTIRIPSATTSRTAASACMKKTSRRFTTWSKSARR